ncbi:hypothetical protein E4U09_006039 [Claviceps aff. purpurea]|uniref:Uncharacterized protein n=1 Tax=Claviceps aff. purpurea TaxID=1967640 RepID=A0A9P7U415_9HYPO|nr:hypothetical protein E4U09_006039 [Claviceps aff. purpurea]
MSHLFRSDWDSLSRDTTELASLHEQSHKEQFFKADGSHISWLQSIKSYVTAINNIEYVIYQFDQKPKETSS